VRGRWNLSPRVVTSSLLGACAAAASVGLIVTAAWLISRAAEQPNVAALGLAIVGVRFFGVSRGVFRYAERVTGHDAALRGQADLRVRVYRKLERLAPSGLPAFRSGDLLVRLVDDVDRLQDLAIRVVPPYVVATLVGLLTAGLLFWVLPLAGATLLFGFLLAATVVPALSNWQVRRSEARQALTRGQLSTAVLDLLNGAPDLIAYGADVDQLARAGALDRQLAAQARAAARTAGLGGALTLLLGGLACWGALVAGIVATTAGELDGTLLAVVVLTPLAAAELMVALPSAAATFERVEQSRARLAAVSQTPDPVREPEQPLEVPKGPHTVSVTNVRARYAQHGPWALDGVHLLLAPGRPVAVVGRSGAGKSTLAAVLVRFLDVAEGEITLNGLPLDRLRGADVREVIGLCEQNGHLFDTTIAENLLLASPVASRKRLRDVLESVELLGWVDGLPDGLDTEVGERGCRLSGGQRQRLVLARTLLADFPVMVFDEPTEHLDTAAADALMAALFRLTSEKATLIITHRLAGVAEADEIVVLDSGRVAERGRHDVLLGQGGRYAQLWAREQDLALSETGSAPDSSRPDDDFAAHTDHARTYDVTQG
jgi:thiol reductant ABC exporter CydC subunit